MHVFQEKLFHLLKKEDKAKIVDKYKVGDIIKGAEVKVTAHLVVFLM